MKKRAAIFWMIILLCGTLSACAPGKRDGAADGQAETGQPGAGEQDAATETPLSPVEVRLGNVTIALGDDMDKVKESLGEPLDCQETQSYVYDGYEKTFTYDGAEIITYPMDGKDIVSSISLLDQSGVSGSGVQVGDDPDTVEKLYGGEQLVKGSAYYLYETEDYGYSFYLGDDGKIAVVEAYVYAE